MKFSPSEVDISTFVLPVSDFPFLTGFRTHRLGVVGEIEVGTDSGCSIFVDPLLSSLLIPNSCCRAICPLQVVESGKLWPQSQEF